MDGYELENIKLYITRLEKRVATLEAMARRNGDLFANLSYLADAFYYDQGNGGSGRRFTGVHFPYGKIPTDYVTCVIDDGVWFEIKPQGLEYVKQRGYEYIEGRGK